MKNQIMVIALLVSNLAGVQAQVAGTATTATARQPDLPAPTGFSPVSRDGSSTVWERTVYQRSPDGTVVPRKSRYTELATGLNYRDQTSGQWVPSRETIDLLPPGGAFAAEATQGQAQARFPLDLAQGVIQLTTPDGKQLTSRPAGLFFEDDHNSVLIAVLTNSVGELVGSNSVVYPNAFGGLASIRFRYSRSGFEQDVLVQGQLPDPAAWGLVPSRTKLGVLSAFFDINNPVVTPGPVDAASGLNDATLTFGKMTMSPGRTFVIGNSNPNDSRGGGTPTYKRWFKLNGRNFLIEEVPYPRVAPQLEQLPQTGRTEAIATNLFAANSVLDQISATPSALPARGAEVEPRQMQLARTDWDQRRALVLDYPMTLNNSLGDTVLQGDTTYRVSGMVYCFGAMKIEGGAVIKYDQGVGAALFLAGTVDCQTTPYHPAVFTAVDDNTVGEGIVSGSPSGYYADDALLVYASTQPTDLHDLRISHALHGIVAANPGVRYLIRDCQICQVGYAIDNYFAQSVTVQNTLIYQASEAAIHSYYTPCSGAQLTIDQAGCVFLGEYYYNDPSLSLSLVNSLLVSISSGGTQYTGDHNATPLNPATVFQTVGGGAHYLANGSIYRQAGTASINPALLAELAAKTTYPPVVCANTQITSGILTTPPQRPRDTASPGPDLGYHYDPLDYIFLNCSVGSDLTFPAGTAVGWQAQGLSFPDNRYNLNFNGTVNQPCYFVRCNTVQEADATGDGTGIAGSIQSPTLAATFTRFSALGHLAAFFDAYWVLADPINNCEFWSGLIGGNVIGAMQSECYNCLFDRTFINLTTTGDSVGYLTLKNCTVHGGDLKLLGSDFSTIRDTAFDGTTIEANNGSYASSSYNAYNSLVTDRLPNDQNDEIVQNTFNWQRGLLGNYYLPPPYPPPNDGRLLIDHGDSLASQINVIVNGGTSAEAPLSEFTTDPTINQGSDANYVDIGYHYVPILGPQLTLPCSPRESGLGVELDWSVADIVQQTFSTLSFKIYRSGVSGGPYTLIATVDGALHYWDTAVALGQTYYYVVTYEYQVPGTIRESPYSNQITVTASSSPTLLAADAWWDVTVVGSGVHIGLVQAPFGWPSDYPDKWNRPQLPAITSEWREQNTWSNYYNLNLSGYSAQQLAQVKFSFAIDNLITVYVNGHQLADPIPGNWYGNGGAGWSPLQQLPHLVAGNNDIWVVIGGDNLDCYFSMVITAADCLPSGP